MKIKQILRFRNWPVLTKMLVVMLFFSWIPVAVATTFAVTRQAAFARAEMDNYILSQTSDTVSELQKLVIRFLQQTQDVLQNMAINQETIQFLEASSIERPLLAKDLTDALVGAVDISTIIGDITLYDRQGIAVASRDLERIGRKETMRQDIQQALAGERVIGSIHIGPDDVPGFFISTPVRQDNEIIGVVSARLHADFILLAISGTAPGTDQDIEATGDEITDELAQKTDVYLVDENGIVMVHMDPQSDWLYRSLREVDQETLARIESSAALGSACPQDAETCDSQEMEARLPFPMPALAPLGDALHSAFESGEAGTARYCHPEDIDSAPDPACRSGNWHTVAYEPLHDPTQDRVMFLIVVDVPEDPLQSSIRRQAILGISLVSVLFAILIADSIYVARLIAGPVRKLAHVAQDVEEDKPFEPQGLADITRFNDELGHLARVFGDMVVAVQERERKLKQQVQDMRIEINQGKRERQVKAIVEDDFFQDLQSKARQMRAEKKKKRRDKDDA